MFVCLERSIVTVWVKEEGRILQASLTLISGPLFGLSPPRIESVTWEDAQLAEGAIDSSSRAALRP